MIAGWPVVTTLVHMQRHQLAQVLPIGLEGFSMAFILEYRGLSFVMQIETLSSVPCFQDGLDFYVSTLE